MSLGVGTNFVNLHNTYKKGELPVKIGAKHIYNMYEHFSDNLPHTAHTPIQKET
jgi:hypothetical protein